jgi:two-component system, OmpR family, response regulator
VNWQLRQKVLLKIMRILVVEDEKKTASFVKKALEAEGFAVDAAHNGDDGLALAQTTPYDAVVLDIMLPGRDGLGVLKQLRDRRSNIPVLLLSARGAVEERVDGLNAGADDYLAKPFVLAELIARVRALVRRNNSRSVLLQLGNLTVNTITREVKRGSRVIDLSAREYRLLEFLLRSQGHVCSRMQILEKVWDYDFDPGTNLVDVYVRRVRDKVDIAPDKPLLHTVRGVGYVMKEIE